MKLDQVDTESRVLHVARLKDGLSTTQPLRTDELGAVNAWLKERARMKPTGKAFFVSEQRKPLHRSTVNLLLRKYSAAASMPLLAHPHMLRHACGFSLADAQFRPARLLIYLSCSLNCASSKSIASNWRKASPRTDAYIVYLFLMLRGFNGGCKDQHARLLLEESITQSRIMPSRVEQSMAMQKLNPSLTP